MTTARTIGCRSVERRREWFEVGEPLDEHLDLAAAGEANLLDILLLGDAVGEQFGLACAERLQPHLDHRGLDAATAHRASDIARRR